MVNKYIILPLFFIFSFSLNGQNFDTLIQMSWKNNDQLKAQHFKLKHAEAALREAKSLYGPTAMVGAQYTLATGGREIDFPIGDLLNPVYGTLNQLTQTQNFPNIENEKISFLPHNFLDAKLRIQQPIFYPDLKINRQFQEKKIDLKALEILAYKRLLSKEVMIAYLQWQMSIQAIDIYENALVLISEAKRVTNSLIRNGKNTPSSLYRIESQQAAIDQKIIESKSNEQNAWKLLAFLLNDSKISKEKVFVALPEFPEINTKKGIREELQQIETGIQMQQLAVKKENQFYYPKIGAQLDLGSQDFNFNWKPYALLGINLEWTIYDHKRHIAKKNQAKAMINAQEMEKLYVQKQLDLQVEVSENNYKSAKQQAETFQPRIESANKIYREILKKYKIGISNYLELIDAQTLITNTKISYNIARYNTWIKWAELEYVTARYPIN